MKSIAFVGLGIMGLPMALNLKGAGYSVVGVVRRGKTHPTASDAGLAVTDDVVAAVAGADVVITMLPDSPDVRAILAEAGPYIADGALVIDMSTIDPIVTREIRESVLRPAVRMLDAPVSGGEAGAVEGMLSIMIGGSEADFQDAEPIFRAMGKTIVHVGELGSGQVVKAANQMVVAGNIQILAEAVVFLRAQGADLPAALQVLGGGLAGSTVLERKRTAMLGNSFAPGFRLALHAKDLGIVQSTATATGLSLPLTAAVTQLVRALVARGDGQLDHSALLKLTEELNGRER